MTPQKTPQATKTPGIRSKGEKTDRELWEELKEYRRSHNDPSSHGEYNLCRDIFCDCRPANERAKEIEKELGTEKMLRLHIQDVESRIARLERRRWFW